LDYISWFYFLQAPFFDFFQNRSAANLNVLRSARSGGNPPKTRFDENISLLELLKTLRSLGRKRPSFSTVHLDALYDKKPSAIHAPAPRKERRSSGEKNAKT